jgi:hypothetical protein
MRAETPLSRLLLLSILSMSAATLPPVSALAELACSGHKLLRNPRPIELQQCKTGHLRIPRRRPSRTRVSGRCQPLCHARHGKPHRNTHR